MLPLHPTEVELIHILFQGEGEYHSSKELAQQLNLSDKTIRKYLVNLEGLLQVHGGRISMKKGSGYRLNIVDRTVFYHYMNSLVQQSVHLDDAKLLTSNKERERYLLNAILLENRKETIDDFSSQLYISRSTVSTVVQSIKNRLNKFELSVHYSSEGYLQIVGEEVQRRRFILHYFFRAYPQEAIFDNSLLNFDYPGFSLETIFILVLEQCREYEVQLSDYVLQNLVLHIALAIKRYSSGYSINDVSLDTIAMDTKEYFVAQRLIRHIEQLIGIQIPQSEANYIALHLMSKANRQSSGNHSAQDASLSQSLQQALTKIRQTNPETPFAIDAQLIHGLMAHFKPLLTRLAAGIKLENPLYDEMQEKYGDVITMTREGLSNLSLLRSYKVDDHEWAYISLHLLAAIERYKQERRLKVIVICATGLGSAQVLRTRLENEFQSAIEISSVISYYQLKDEMLTDVQLIISTVDITTSFYSIPVVKVSVFLNRQDIELIRSHLKTKPVLPSSDKSIPWDAGNFTRVFDRYFDASRFIVVEEMISRQALLAQMMGTLTDAADAQFKVDLLSQINLREQYGTLAFSDQVAFPHPAQPVGVNSELVVAVCVNGLEWDRDHPNIQLVILMSHSKIANPQLDTINSLLAELITQEQWVDRLLEEPSFRRWQALLAEITQR